MYIVCWMTDLRDDHWEACETLAMARRLYARVVAKPDTYTASITAVIESTDYTAPEA